MRTLLHTYQAKPAQDGDGVKIRRIAGPQLNDLLDPFLMIDEINSDEAADYIGGFPEHPHRGFETITYMKAGRMRHRDHMGNEGVIEAGDVQWMTAGKGVLHSEMPEQEGGLLHGFQLWLNLPAAEKMNPAAYREISADEVVQSTLAGGGTVSLIAGQMTVDSGALLSGPLPERSTTPVLADLELSPGEETVLNFSHEQTVLVYVYSGATTELSQGQLGVYSTGEELELAAAENKGAGMLILSGRALQEPIVQYGPFVMNSRIEIEQAFQDFRQNNFV